jgi:hypothetical protein
LQALIVSIIICLIPKIILALGNANYAIYEQEI